MADYWRLIATVKERDRFDFEKIVAKLLLKVNEESFGGETDLDQRCLRFLDVPASRNQR